MNASKPRSQAAAKLQTPERPIPIAFISGPLERDPAYFERYYASRILKAIRAGHMFVLGCSRGTDTIAYNFLGRYGVVTSRIRIYMNSSEETQIRGAFKQFEQAGGSVVIVKGGHEERDEAMTRASHYDILRYRTESECQSRYGAAYRKHVSDTEKNELRRKAGLGLTMPATGDESEKAKFGKDSKA
ncbi:hypothetical protein M413DRAFT_447364 [Hebeloma cylindrosporum]|uniref:Uncharacterized protein n=1 Tax=Hebeloma cylindrosporum TaxID=76867 RepID=A0A0C2YD84_HEBCY|nr:hypothetical protein M413DRAFT_447364 [Hebeloma cylindrosporum h7]